MNPLPPPLQLPQPPHYIPAHHLVKGSFLTADQLIYFFQDFYSSLDRIAGAPDLVFERLVANLNTAVPTYAGRDRNPIEGESETCDGGKNDRAKAELAGLATTISGMEQEAQRQSEALRQCTYEKEVFCSMNEHLKSELQDLKSTIEASELRQSQLEKCNREADTIRSSNSLHKAEIHELKLKGLAAVGEHSHWVSTVEKLQTANLELQSSNDRLDTQVAELRSTVASITLERDECITAHEKCSRERIASRDLILRVKGVVNDLRSELSKAQLGRDQKTAALKACMDGKESLTFSNDRLKAELMELRSAIVMLGETACKPCTLWAASQPSTNVTPVPTVGTVYISPPKSNTTGRNSKVVRFTPEYDISPRLSLGFTSLDIAGVNGIHLTFCSHGVQNTECQICCPTWVRTSLHSATCSWLAIGPSDPAFESGVFHAIRTNSPHQQQSAIEHYVTFTRNYSTPPHVIVWLTGIHIDHGSAIRIHTFPTSSTTTGFELNIRTRGPMKSIDIGWLACRRKTAKIHCGSLRMLGHSEIATRSSHMSFGTVFTSPPQVFLAVNEINVDCKPDMCFKLEAEKVTVDGMSWSLTVGVGTVVNSIGAVSVALP